MNTTVVLYILKKIIINKLRGKLGKPSGVSSQASKITCTYMKCTYIVFQKTVFVVLVLNSIQLLLQSKCSELQAKMCNVENLYYLSIEIDTLNKTLWPPKIDIMFTKNNRTNINADIISHVAVLWEGMVHNFTCFVYQQFSIFSIKDNTFADRG